MCCFTPAADTPSTRNCGPWHAGALVAAKGRRGRRHHGSGRGCCGESRAYELGYAGELIKYCEHQNEVFRNAGVKTVVTPCADCLPVSASSTTKVGKKPAVEVLHITQYLERLIREGKLVLKNSLPLRATYHDPCHLGRLGEPWIHWNGKGDQTQEAAMWLHDPPRNTAAGPFDPPRNLLKKHPRSRFCGNVPHPRIWLVLRCGRRGDRRLPGVCHLDQRPETEGSQGGRRRSDRERLPLVNASSWMRPRNRGHDQSIGYPGAH